MPALRARPCTVPPLAARARPGPRRGGTLVTVLRGDVASWSPYATAAPSAAALLALLYPRLAREGVSGLEPWLASSWETSSDGLSISFHLRPDAAWSSGAPVTCDDVRFTWQAQVSDALDWPRAALKRRIRRVECADARTAVF